MADYFTQFSCIFDVSSAAHAAEAEAIRNALAAELDRDDDASLGFEMQLAEELGPGALWLHSDEFGEPEHVIAFVLRCAAAFALTGVWGFTWSHSCSRPRLDAFGGGAHVVDLGRGESITDLDCAAWLVEQTARETPHEASRAVS